jgi:hypothetical protein
MNLNMMQKKALIGGLVIAISFIGCLLYIGKKNLWFESKNKYWTKVKDADGLSEGGIVSMSGIRIGEVTELYVREDNSVEVRFTIKSSLQNKIRAGAAARLYRAFVIGEKRLDILPGSPEGALIPEGGELKGMESSEIVDLVSGKNIGQFTSRFEVLTEGLGKWQIALEKLTEKMDPESMAKIYDLLRPTLENISVLSNDLRILKPMLERIDDKMLKSNLVEKTLTAANKTLAHTDKILGPVAKREVLLEQALDNLNALSSEMAKNPTFAKDLIGTLKEVTTTLKAIQKTWFLKGHVEDVKKKEP